MATVIIGVKSFFAADVRSLVSGSRARTVPVLLLTVNVSDPVMSVTVSSGSFPLVVSFRRTISAL